MLTLSRRVGERIVIAGNIIVEVVAVNERTGIVKLAFTAPQEVKIWREELLPLRSKKEGVK